MKPFLHAKGSVRRFGGDVKDYMSIHDFLDSTKASMPDMRHRVILHSAFGIYLVEQIFGHIIINSKNKEISTRDIAEKHVIEDMGTIPTIQDYLKHMPMLNWLGGPKRNRKVVMELDLQEVD